MGEKWQFVHDVRGGWWLRLTSDEDIVRYIQATNTGMMELCAKQYKVR